MPEKYYSKNELVVGLLTYFRRNLILITINSLKKRKLNILLFTKLLFYFIST